MNAISRRDFVAGLGGITLAFTLAPRLAGAQQPARLPGSLNDNRMLYAWIRIGSDGMPLPPRPASACATCR